jgi:peptide/nickel transport system ATP-binding protein
MLAIDNLTLSCPIDGRRIDLLRNLTVSLARGRVLGLVGESGAGKSMIGRIIAGHTCCSTERTCCRWSAGHGARCSDAASPSSRRSL